MKNKTINRLSRKAHSWHELIRNHIFVDYLHKRTIDDVVTRIRIYTPVLKKYKALLDAEYKKMCRKYRWFYDPDNRSGKESYGYRSVEHVQAELVYISDKFAAEFRLQWLIDLPDNIIGTPETTPNETQNN